MCSTKQIVNIIHSEKLCTLEVSVKENLWPVSVTWYRIHCCLLQLTLKTFWHCSSHMAYFGHCYSYFWTLLNINICSNAFSYLSLSLITTITSLSLVSLQLSFLSSLVSLTWFRSHSVTFRRLQLHSLQ